MKKNLQKQQKNKVAGAKFYDELLLKEEACGHDLLFSDLELTMQFLQPLKKMFKGKRVLEIGCGVGHLAHILKEKFEVSDIVATDISPKSVEKARELYPKGDYEVMKGEDLRFKKNSFDIVISIETLEHIANYRKHLEEVKRVLRPGGYYIVETPNNPFNVAWETLRGNREGLAVWHPSLFSPTKLKSELEEIGLEVKFYKQKSFTPKSKKKLARVFGPFGNLIAKWFPFKFLPVNFLPTLFLIAKKT